jgi:tetratricopeptide (TPR) repeat protein
MPESLLKESNRAHRRGNFKRALELLEECLARLGAELSPMELNELWVLKSHCLNAQGHWQEALSALESAAQVGKLDAEALARLAMHKGYLMGSLTRYAECWSYLGQAERTARDLGLTTFLAEVLWRRGMISTFMGEHVSAENCLNSALDIATKAQERRLEGLITAGLAKSVMYRGEYAEAVRSFERALAIFEELEDHFYSAIIWTELANCYLHLHEPEKALDFFQRAERVFLESGATPNYQVCLANIGNAYLYRSEFLTAISYYQRALKLARELGDRLSVAKWLRNLAQAYTHLGSPELAERFDTEATAVEGQLALERERAAQVAPSLQ